MPKKREDITDELLIDLYCNHKKTCVQIGKELKAHDECIRIRLKKLGVDTGLNRKNLEHGHMFENLSNRKFGKLTVNKLSYKKVYNNKQGKSPYYYWNCTCDCGEKVIRPSYRIKIPKYQQCKKCRHLELYGIPEGYKGVTGSHYKNIANHAKRINKEIQLTPKEMWEIFENQNYKCALTGLDLILPEKLQKTRTASLDRIDSSKGYTKDNVWWIHKKLQFIKGTSSVEELLYWSEKMIDFKRNKNVN